jgi:hypothetical protein
MRVEKDFGKGSEARAVASGASYRPLVDPLLSRHEGLSYAIVGLLIIESCGGVCKSLSAQAERDFFLAGAVCRLP